ncbi:MAG: family 10 glycosylhydrolase [Kiritimatiellae bacterium]|nr:family 10 glycosylhydrolase [Kiritimatiellia bacterium]
MARTLKNRRGHAAAAVILLAAACAGARAADLDAFAYPSAEAARKAWKPVGASPPVAPAAGGLDFPCPFRRDLERVYWDREISADLSPYTSIELDLACDNPRAVRSLLLYFKSGDGWYAARVPLAEPGRQTVRLLKSDFSTEDRPRGWGRIERIRLSAWPGVREDTALTAYGLRARANGILLVRCTTATDDAAERKVAARVTGRVSRWLKRMNVPHGVVTDDEVTAGGLSGASVAVLCYNPHPPPRELSALERFVRGGGKLVVLYGADPGVAKLMGVRLGTYQRSDVPGRWSAFAFADADGWNVPPRVYQDSTSLMPAEPAARSTKVIARWENAAGKKTGDAAWLAGAHGLWMTHVLLDDDERNKARMLLGLLGHLEPAVWRDAARGCLERVGKIDSFRGFAETRDAVAARAGNAASPKRVNQLLDQAATMHERMNDLYARGRFADVVSLAGELRERLVEAYGRVQTPRPGELRGVWDHAGTGWYPGDWDRTCAILEREGINTVFANLLWGGVAHYPSRILPASFTARKFGDQAEAFVKAARRHGLQAHAWKVCWNLENAPAAFVERMKEQGRLQRSADGRTLPWLCPSDPRNVDLEVDALKELVARYDLDGVHLDYVRYPGSDACFAPASRAAFETWLGRKAAGWPGSVRAGGKLAPEFRRWRTQQISLFVRRVTRELKAVKPGIRVSAAVWGNYPACVDSVGQDWAEWVAKGYVDFVCPMNYTEDPTRFTTMTHDQLQLPGARGRVFPGLGVTAHESQLSADQVIEQVAALHRLGAPGFVLFDLSHTLREETLPALRWGLTADTP